MTLRLTNRPEGSQRYGKKSIEYVFAGQSWPRCFGYIVIKRVISANEHSSKLLLKTKEH